MLVFDGAHQVGLGAEVIADRGVVALSRSLTHLTVGNRVHAVFGIQPFGGLEDCFLGGARAIGTVLAVVTFSVNPVTPGKSSD